MNSSLDGVEIFGVSSFLILVTVFSVYVFNAKLFLSTLKKERPEVYQYLDYPTVFDGFSSNSWHKKLDDPYYLERRTPSILATEKRMDISAKVFLTLFIIVVLVVGILFFV